MRSRVTGMPYEDNQHLQVMQWIMTTSPSPTPLVKTHPGSELPSTSCTMWSKLRYAFNPMLTLKFNQIILKQKLSAWSYCCRLFKV